MKKKLAGITAFFAVLIVSVIAGFYLYEYNLDEEETRAEQIIAVNEIEQLARMGENEHVVEKALILKEDLRESDVQNRSRNSLLMVGGICLLFLAVVFGYIYFAILRPFDRIENFAEKIAQGNFDIPLNYERTNYFGKFTWAFDSMRKEIIKARSCEREAVENNKTVIATLSHDIKTPIASIRAYAEGLEAHMDTSPERRAKYLSVIMKKCDEVSGLTNDLFLHSLSDLEKIQISSESFEICGFLKTAIEEIAGEQADVKVSDPPFTAIVSADKKRVIQITENIINNARKYAKTNMEVSFTKSDTDVMVHFRDYGSGIPDEDMPFIFDKFYRGHNCADEQGSGLGLYIIKYLAEKMNGKVLLHNHGNGLEVTVVFSAIK